MENVVFEEIFDIETLQKLMDSLSKSFEVGLCIRSPQGERLLQDSVSCDFCRDIVQKSPLGKKQCEESDVVLSAYKEISPKICRCKSAGLMDAGINLIVDGIHIGSILVGQVRLKENELSEEEYRRIARSLNLDEEEYMKGLNRIPIMSKEKFDCILESMTIIAHQLSMLGYHNLQQRRKISLLEREESSFQRDREQLRRMAETDAMTGIYNRAKFEELTQMYEEHRNLKICMVSADVNNLKLMNDIFGHEAGDNLLKAATRKLLDAAKEDWTVARCGGDEFRILMPNTELNEAQEYCKTVTRNCEMDKSLKLPIAISLGAAQWDSSTETLQSCFNRADTLMYQNKKKMKQEENLLDYVMQRLYENRYLNEAVVNEGAKLAYEFAVHMGFSEEAAENVRLAALYQDVGLILVPESMMRKGRSATPEEQSCKREHVKHGYNMALQFEKTSKIANFILCSHESWDGRSYPNNLRGRQIPLESRIIRIADNFAYWREPSHKGTVLSLEDAKENLRRQAGTNYDPDMVEWFISFIENR